jgi:hypothetical protein
MNRAISTIVQTVEVSITVLDPIKFAAAYDHWRWNLAVQARPNKKQFFQHLAIHANEGNNQPAIAAGCSVYWLGEKRQISTYLTQA